MSNPYWTRRDAVRQKGIDAARADKLPKDNPYSRDDFRRVWDRAYEHERQNIADRAAGIVRCAYCQRTQVELAPLSQTIELDVDGRHACNDCR